MRKIYTLLVIFLMFGASTTVFGQAGQCGAGGCAGPGVAFGAAQSTTSATFVNAVAGTWQGEYNTYNVTAGQQYEWSLCTANGAVNGGGDTQLTLKTTGNANLCYSDDLCGAAPKILWTATFTGQVRVLINQFSCATGTASHTVRWRCVSCAPPPGCTYTVPFSGNNAITTNTGTICEHAGTANYSNGANGFTTINPSVGGQAVRLTFNTFNLECCCDFVTVFNGAGVGGTVLFNGNCNTLPPVLTSTTGPLTIRFTSDGSVVGTGFSATITNVPLTPSGCTNSIAFGSAAAPTNNVPVTINTCTYQNEYNTITGVAAGSTYQSSYSLGGFITVRSGTFNGPVVASGNTPLTWTATVAGNHFIHYNTNSACGTASSCGTSTITCTSCPAPAFNPCTTLPNIAACATAVSTTWTAGQIGAWNPIANTCGYSTPGQERLFTFTPTVSGIHQINVTAITGGWVDFFWKAASGGCNNSGWTCIQDVFGNGTYGSLNMTAGVQYYIMADPEHTNAGTLTFNVTCPVIPPPPSPTSVTASTNSLCSNSLAPVTLTANGASGTVYWFTSGCNTSGWFTTGNPIVVNPSSTTTYFARNFDGTQWSTTCASTTVTVSTNPAAPTATASLTAICQGGSTNLNGTGVGTISWYDAPTGGNLVGTSASGADFNVAPTSNTTYYAENTGSGGCPSTRTPIAITVDAPSVAPTAITNLDPTICNGATTQLDVVGGSLSAGAQWEWSDASCGGAVLGTGASINVTPNGTTTYYVRASAGNSCAASTCEIIAVTMPAVSTNLSIDGDVATCTVNSNNWIHFYDANARLIASVNSNGQDLGDVTATTLVASNPFIMTSCTQPWDPSWFNAALARSFIITPTTQPTSPVSVRLYIADTEFNDYQTAALGTPGNLNDDVLTITDMDMTKHSGPSEDGNPLNNCGVGSTIYVPQSGSGLTSAVMGGFSGSYYIEYSISSFSEMFPMNSANSPLPVSLTSFNANCADDKVNITWTTASEFNASQYSLQTSRDGQTWTEVAEIAAAGTTSQESNYAYQDFLFGGVSYYRLVQVDLDGASEIYGPISVDCEISESSMTVYPNPTDNDFTVLIQTTESFENATIELVDLSGRAVEVKEMNILPGSTQVRFETKGIMPGTYIVRIKGENDTFTPIRVVIL